MSNRKRILSFLIAAVLSFTLLSTNFASVLSAAQITAATSNWENHDAQAMQKEISLMAASIEENIIGNEYIEFNVSENDEDSGRFTIGNTGGNPEYSSDNGKKLMFGHPNPWSSYTTIVIDGEAYYFKADNTDFDKANLRAVSTMTVDGVEIKQTIQIVNNETTGIKDTVKISYSYKNTANTSKNVGIRIMLDTMLGDNDGAPFKVPSLGNVTTEKELSGSRIPSSWQAFDNLSNASVFAVGTLYKSGERRPDKVQFASWGNVYYSAGAYNYIIDPGQSVTGDSAVAIYWDAKPLAAGNSSSVCTYYGVGRNDNPTGSGTTEAPINVPSTGFAVMAVDENQSPVSGVQVEIATSYGPKTYVTDENGVVTMNNIGNLPVEGIDGNANTIAKLTLTKQSYLSTNTTRIVKRGDLIVVTMYPDDGKVHISSVLGYIDDKSIDLLQTKMHFDSDAQKTDVADDSSNVKQLRIDITVSSASRISRYQIVQGSDVVFDSYSPVISVPILTGTISEPQKFVNNLRITKLDAGKKVYIRLMDNQNNEVAKKQIGIIVSEPSYVELMPKNGKGSISLGEKIKITVPDDIGIPFIGGAELEFGELKDMPILIEISEDGKVKFAFNPNIPDIESEKWSVSGKNQDSWETIAKDYKEAVQLARSSLKKKSLGKKKVDFTSIGATKFELDIMGYGEGYWDEIHNELNVEVGFVVTATLGKTLTWTFYVPPVPIPISVDVGFEGEVEGRGKMGLIYANKKLSLVGGDLEVEASASATPELYLGVKSVVGASVGGTGKLTGLLNFSNNYQRLTLSGEAFCSAWFTIFKGKKYGQKVHGCL